MMDLIVIAVVALIAGAAARYIYKEKKRGTVCIGCPNAGTCSRHSGGTGSCGCHTDSN